MNKPGRLSGEEFAPISTYVPIGCEIMQLIAPPWPLQSIMAQRHERLDGSGYPHRLTREPIEIEPRVIAVCDAFETLCDERLYRKALGVAGALDKFRHGSGKTLDADLDAALDSLAPPLRTDRVILGTAGVGCLRGAELSRSRAD